MSHRILVIDHHPQGLQRVVDPLRQAGYEVAVAQTVADGASKFGSFGPALVFIAARLPRTHGTVLCRELKRTDAGVNTPIVLIVEGTGIQIDLPPLDQFGADRLIQKPVSADELLAVCRELLGGEPQSAPTDSNETGSQPRAEPDDGLSNALEELDALDFDLPEEVVRGPRDTPPQPSVQLSHDSGEDIEDHIEDLLTEKKKSAAPVSPEPSTGRDHDADEAVIDQLELENELNTTLGADEKASATQPAIPPTPARVQDSTKPSRSEIPPAPSATTTESEPAPESEQTAGRFQTEAFTSKRTMPQPFPVVADVKPVTGLAHWSWVAIPVTVAVVFLAAFFMARPRETRTETDLAATPFSLPVDAIDETDPPIGAIEPARDAAAEALIEQPEVATRETAPTEPAPTKPSPLPSRPAAREPAPDPETRSPIEREPEAAIRNEALAPSSTRPAADVAADQPSSEPATPEPQAQPVEDDPAPIVESTPLEPAPAPITEATPPSTADSASQDPAPPTVVQDPESRIVVPDPITRDPILIQRVEPNMSKKDLKKGGGTVVLRVHISESGAVTRVLVEQGLPGSPLEAAAVAAVLRWRYEPALDRDEPVRSWTLARFTFE